MTMDAGLPPAHRELSSVVVLPVRNEGLRIEAALAALAAQRELDGGWVDPRTFEVLLLANNCDDDSAALARRFAAATPTLRLHVVEATLEPHQANIGFVRRMLMDAACARLESAGRPDGAICSTDGDTRVAPDWLARNRRELAAGADAVGGRIVDDHADHLAPATLRLQRLDAVHALLRSRLADLIDPDEMDPWPRHHQHFGASLAVTARAYRRAGGVPDVPWLEDEALVRAIERAGGRVRHSPHVRVATSQRLDGRAPVGLSWQLRQWAEAPPDRKDPPVESPRRWERALTARVALRNAWPWTPPRLAPVSAEPPLADQDRALGLELGTVAEAMGSHLCFAAAWQEIERARVDVAAGSGDTVPLTHAVVELRAQVRARETEQAQAGLNTSSRYCG